MQHYIPACYYCLRDSELCWARTWGLDLSTDKTITRSALRSTCTDSFLFKGQAQNMDQKARIQLCAREETFFSVNTGFYLLLCPVHDSLPSSCYARRLRRKTWFSKDSVLLHLCMHSRLHRASSSWGYAYSLYGEIDSRKGFDSIIRSQYFNRQFYNRVLR